MMGVVIDRDLGIMFLIDNMECYVHRNEWNPIAFVFGDVR